MATKSLSLVEQKKLQWAKEREELAGLGALWGANVNNDGYRPCIRTRYVSAMDLSQAYAEHVDTLHRSPSLPRVRHDAQHQNELHVDRRKYHYEDVHSNEGETSGYASDTNEWHQKQQANWEEAKRVPNQQVWPGVDQGYTSPESTVSSPPYGRVARGATPPSRQWSSGDEASRLKWGDRGVGVGHLWEPAYHEPDCRLPQVDGSERATPVWLERGLHKLDTTGGSQILVINHPPSAGESQGMNRKLAGSLDSISIPSPDERSFIRGQNAPVDPEVLMEREAKRQKALELQNAIRQQLEERDKKRKAEIEKRIKEEREEDDRIRKERERERQRVEEEQKKKKEKEEKEAQKAQAMKEALETADKMAREEKSRASRKHVIQNLPEFPKEIQCNACLTSTPPETGCLHNPPTPVELAPPPHEPTAPISDKLPSDKGRKEGVIISAEPIMSPEGLPIVVDGDMFQGHEIPKGVQLALLMSPGLLMEQTGRLLTPSRYRGAGRECSTQTDADIVAAARDARRKSQRKVRMKEREKSASQERPHRGCKLPLRCRAQSQPRQRLSLEDRPKWGVNRPDTQYRKQSEKDPYYQRKLRKRQSNNTGTGDTGTDTDNWNRQARHFTSDDCSRSPSPPQRFYSRKIRPQYTTKHSKSNKLSHDSDKHTSPPLSPIESLDDNDEKLPRSNKRQLGYSKQRAALDDDVSDSNLGFNQRRTEFSKQHSSDNEISESHALSDHRRRTVYNKQYPLEVEISESHVRSNRGRAGYKKQHPLDDDVSESHVRSYRGRAGYSKQHPLDGDVSELRVSSNQRRAGIGRPRARDDEESTLPPYSNNLRNGFSHSRELDGDDSLPLMRTNQKRDEHGKPRDEDRRRGVETSNYLVQGKRLLTREVESPITIETNEKNLEDWTGEDILSQLTTLRNGLKMKQKQWENPRCTTPLSDSSWFSNS